MAFAGIEGRSRDVLRAHIPRCSERHLEIHSRIDGQPLYAPGNILVRAVEEKKHEKSMMAEWAKSSLLMAEWATRRVLVTYFFKRGRAVDVMWAGI